MGTEVLSILIPVGAVLLVWSAVRAIFPEHRRKGLVMIFLFLAIMAYEYMHGGRWMSVSLMAYALVYWPTSIIYALINRAWCMLKMQSRESDGQPAVNDYVCRALGFLSGGGATLKLTFVMMGLLFSSTCSAASLVTASYSLSISQHCPEGEVSCGSVMLDGALIGSGKKILLTGKTLHSLCADDESPCRFQGYEFIEGEVTYRALESGLFQVIRGGSEVILEEQGAWDW